MTQTDDDDSEVVRTLLSSVEIPPGRLTAQELLNGGRQARQRRRKRSIVATSGALVLTVGALLGVKVLAAGPDPATATGIGIGGPAATGAPSPIATSARPTPSGAPRPCAAQRLTLPKGATGGDVNAGSPNGRYLVGFYTDRKDASVPVWWNGDQVRPIPVDGTGEAHAVNDNGIVVGEATGVNGSFPWIYLGGQLIHLPIPMGYFGGEATGINAKGDVSGVVFGKQGNAAVVWRANGVDIKALLGGTSELRAPGSAMAFGISDSGIVVGELVTDSEGQPYQWDVKGRGSKLALPPGAVGGNVYATQGDWAYGSVHSTSGRLPVSDEAGPVNRDKGTAVVWNLRDGTVTTIDNGKVGAINRNGQSIINRDDHTVMLREPDGTLQKLTSPGNLGLDAYTLSDDGTVVAGTMKGQPVRWFCPA